MLDERGSILVTPHKSSTAIFKTERRRLRCNPGFVPKVRTPTQCSSATCHIEFLQLHEEKAATRRKGLVT